MMTFLKSKEFLLRKGQNSIPKVFILDETQKWFNLVDFNLKENLLVTLDSYLLDTDISPNELTRELKEKQPVDVSLSLFLNIINASWILDNKLGNILYVTELNRIFHIKLEPIINDFNLEVICFKFKLTTDKSIIKYHGKGNKIFIVKK